MALQIPTKETLVLETIRRIKAKPKLFEMTAITREDACGTVLCIAGHMGEIIQEHNNGLPLNILDTVEPAIEVIGKLEFTEMCYMDKIGAEEARWRFDQLAPKTRARIAEALLLDYLNTGKVDWVKAGFTSSRKRRP